MIKLLLYFSSVLNNQDFLVNYYKYYKSFKEDLDSFTKNNFNKLSEFKVKKENIKKKYYRDYIKKIFVEINDTKLKII